MTNSVKSLKETTFHELQDCNSHSPVQTENFQNRLGFNKVIPISCGQ